MQPEEARRIQLQTLPPKLAVRCCSYPHRIRLSPPGTSLASPRAARVERGAVVLSLLFIDTCKYGGIPPPSVYVPPSSSGPPKGPSEGEWAIQLLDFVKRL